MKDDEYSRHPPLPTDGTNVFEWVLALAQQQRAALAAERRPAANVVQFPARNRRGRAAKGEDRQEMPAGFEFPEGLFTGPLADRTSYWDRD